MERVKIGLIGCGTIAEVYMTNIRDHYHNLELVAVADMFVEKAKSAAERYGVPVGCSVDELLAMDEIQLVVNLTIPAAHYSINKQVLEAGKHSYCEKPLALNVSEAKELVALAREKGLMCVSAPDTFLGSGIQQSRKLLDSGAIGRPFGFTANLYSPGHELWHPNPGFLFQKGAGPMGDMGPYYMTALVYLLGPIKKISCFTTIGRKSRNILGTWKDTEVDTTYTGIMEFECGAVGTVYMSLDTWDASLPLLEIYGTDGTLYIPDPNFFQGDVQILDGKKLGDMVAAVTAPHPAKLITLFSNQKAGIETVPMEFPHSEDPQENMRGLGVSDMAQAILTGRPSRLNEDVSVHVVEALNAFDYSARTGQVYVMETTCERTAAMDPSWAHWEVR